MKTSRELDPQALSKEEREALRRIKKFAREGKNLNHFLSRRRLAADFNDALFVSWKITHLHLGPPSGGTVPGTSRLLFARVEDDAIYLLDVRDHKSFSQQDLLRIVQTNWPELNAHAKLRGVVGLAQQTSDDDVAKLRAAGINVLAQVGDTVLAPIAGGLTTNRSSVHATLQAIELRAQVRKIEDQLRENPSHIAQCLGITPNELQDPVRLKLHVRGDTVRVIELTSGGVVTEWPITE